MKKILISLISIVILIVSSNQFVYAVDSNKEVDDGRWVSQAFKAAKDFLYEKEVNSDVIDLNPILIMFTNAIKAINIVLLTLLAGLSMIALSITGVRYLTSGASPNQKEAAKQSLSTIFIGMIIGFGAFAIWQIAMSIVRIIIKNLA